jgi:hypothetical protein
MTNEGAPNGSRGGHQFLGQLVIENGRDRILFVEERDGAMVG